MGKPATTHHRSYGVFAMAYRDAKLKRGARSVEAGDNLASAGGLTSGIDLAVRVVERYYGRTVVERTATMAETSNTTDIARLRRLPGRPENPTDRPLP